MQVNTMYTISSRGTSLSHTSSLMVFSPVPGLEHLKFLLSWLFWTYGNGMNWIGLELTFSKSTHKVVNERVKDSTQTQQQSEDVALVELMYLVFTRRPGGSSSSGGVDVPCIYTQARWELIIWWSWCTVYLHTGQLGATVGDSGLCCTCVKSFEC